MTSLEEYRAERTRQVDRARRRRLALAHIRGEATSHVDAGPVRQRLHDLMAVEWSLEAIALLNPGDGSRQGLSLIAAGRHQRVLRKFATVLDIPVSVRVPDVVPDPMFVPTLGVARRIRALLAAGYPLETISAASGRDVSVFSSYQRPRMRAEHWRRIDDVYERFAGPGPSRDTRDRAARLGYVPPLAWDDIDDPRERPAKHRTRGGGEVDQVAVERILAGEVVPADRATRTEVIRRWDAAGRPRNELARLTGWKPERYLLLERDAS